MPNIENLRKQAKQLVRWHRTRHYSVAATIAQYSPKFAGLGDAEVLDREFKLVDAQEIVALREGFSSWRELTEGASEMNQPSSISTARATLVHAEPQLFVSDLLASVRYYESLGFAVAFLYGDPPFYGQVLRDGARLNLRLVPDAAMDAVKRARDDMLSASIAVENVKALFLEFQEAGVVLHQTLRTEPWGARTFIIKDPDGNLILFAE